MVDIEIQTRRLSVNAAFLKDIKDDNRELKQLFDRINPIATHLQAATNHWPELIELIGDLRDQLAFHFSLEEAYGYFEEAIDTAQRLSLEAECLRSEHTALFKEVCSLSDGILEVDNESDEEVERFLADFSGFRHRFEKHEESELNLILGALDDDIGVGD